MRYIILKTEVSLDDGSLNVFGLSSIIKKPSGQMPEWLKLKDAKTNCINPDRCDILSFEEVEEVRELLEISGMEDDETIAYIGVDV